MPSSMPSEVDMPQRSEKAPKSTTEIRKSRTAPKRPESHPVSGTVIASATAYEVITHVPWLEPAPRAPAMFGTVTLAIVMLSTATKFDSASTMPAVQSIPPSREGGSLESMAGCVMAGSLMIAVESGIAIQVDLGIHREPHAQRMGGELIGIQADAH